MSAQPTGTVEGPHCQQCGMPWRPSAENEGYSPCCNQRIVSPVTRGDYRGGRWVDDATRACDPQQCSHLDEAVAL